MIKPSIIGVLPGVALALFSLAALATVGPVSTTPTDMFTLGTSDTQLYTGGPRIYLRLSNVSPTATVCVSFGTAAATISGTTCAAGEILLPPLCGQDWSTPFAPGYEVHAIASAASTPFTGMAH